MIKREFFSSIKAHLSQKEITLIAGPRQAGKTTIMLALKDFLHKQGKKTVFFNLDIEADARFFSSQESLINKIKLEIGSQGGVIFIDEIQRKEDAGLFLKGIYDMNLPYKLVVSGSGSMELKEKIHESLAGRKRLFELSTLSFKEFVNYKTLYRYEDKIADFFSLESEKTNHLLKEYLNFGGYPRVVMAETASEKHRTIDEIYRSYVERDISNLLGIKKTDAFTNLVRVLASQTGGLINYSELSSTLGLSAITVKDYLWYLEKTFILDKVTPFFRNIRKEITKSPTVYFYDLGLRNYAFGVFGQASEGPYAGFLFQNLIFNLLKERTRYTPVKIHFWRTKDGAEVDFILDKAQKPIPIEVKYQPIKQPTVKRSLRSFIDRYKVEKAIVANLSFEKTITLAKTNVEFMPYYKLLDA